MKESVFIISIILNLMMLPAFIYIVIKKYKQITSPNPEDLRRKCKVDVFSILKNESNDIVFIGDSQIERCHWNELFDNNRIKNRGIGGDNVKGLLSRIDQVVEDKPSKIFIMIGINNILVKDNVEQIVSSYRQIVNKINNDSPKTQIYIHSVLPGNNSIWPYKKIDNEKVRSINLKLSQFNDCFYINLYSHLVESNNELNPIYTTDGLHLNGKAYIKWKNLVGDIVSL